MLPAIAMRRQPIILTILFVVFSLNILCQHGQHTFQDSSKVVKAWKETFHFLYDGDTTKQRNIFADTIYFSTHNYRMRLKTTLSIPSISFSRRMLDTLIPNKRLVRSIKNKKPKSQSYSIVSRDGQE